MQTANPLSTEIFDIVTATVANPAAGSQVTFDVPDNTRIQLLSVQVSLVADANAANRLLVISGDDGTNVFQGNASPVNQVQSTTRTYFMSVASAPVDHGTNNAFIFGTIADQLFIEVGGEVSINFSAIQVGDQVATTIIRFKQWITED